jgi:hypothetical protein
MMRDIIERFSYRFRLWHRERREDLFGSARLSDVKIYSKSESVPKMVVRHLSVYFGGIIIATGIGRIIVGFAFPIFVILAVLLLFRTPCRCQNIYWRVESRKKLVLRNATSSNQSLEPTAGRCEVSV